jgi:NADH-quinone oxidoreductase subunit N
MTAASVSLVQSIDYAAISPPLVIAVTALVVLVADLFVSDGRRMLAAYVSMLGTAAALGVTAWLAGGDPRRTFCFASGGCSYVADDYTLFFQVLFLAALLVVLLLSLPLFGDRRIPPGEYHALLLTSVTGMLVLPAARDLVTLIVALEVVSLPAFVLVGLRRGDSRGGEAALKFFLFSVISTAFTVYGMAMVYGATGSIELSHISQSLAVIRTHPGAGAAFTGAGVVLVLVGFAFKISAVPFHFWAPDTYQGAPVPVAAFLSVASKAAGFAGLIVLLVHGFRPYADVWGPVIAVLAAVTMTVGNLVALRQWQLVRLLAWSTVAQAGYLLVPLGVASTQLGRSSTVLNDGVKATLTYLGIYAAINLGAFTCVALVARRHPRAAIEDVRGLVFTAPVTAVLLAFFLTALAGLPPGVAGLFAKVVVLRAAVDGHVTWLAVVAAVNTVIGLAYYLRVAALVFAPRARDSDARARWADHRAGAVALAITAAVTIGLSVYPQPLLHAAGLAAH